jgi:hypothetical protein
LSSVSERSSGSHVFVFAVDFCAMAQSAYDFDPAACDDAARVLRKTISEFRLFPAGRRGEVRAELHGRLAAALTYADDGKPADGDGMFRVVAEEGFEPPTQGL